MIFCSCCLSMISFKKRSTFPLSFSFPPFLSVSPFPSLPLPPSVSLPSLCMSIGIKTTQDAKFYAVSAAFDKFSNEGKTVVIQFTVKHEQRIDCGGGYVKVSACVCV